MPVVTAFYMTGNLIIDTKYGILTIEVTNNTITGRYEMSPSANTNLSSGYNDTAADEKQDTETFDDILTHGLSGQEVHRRAIEARKLFGKAQKALAFWVIEIDTRKIYREFGCSNIYHYATRHLSLGEHTISELLRTGRALEKLPILSLAYERGEISSTHIREITRVATPETESFWCEAAKKSTTRQIEKLVAFSPKGGLPSVQGSVSTIPGNTVPDPAGLTSCTTGCGPKSGSGQISPAEICEGDQQVKREEDGAVAPPSSVDSPGSVTAPVKYHDKLIVELSGEEMSMVKDAFDRAKKESGLRDRASLLMHIVKRFLDGALTAGRETRKPPYQILLHHHLPSGITWNDTLKGETPVPQTVLAKALCDAEIIEVDEPDRPARDLLEEEEKAEVSSRESSDTSMDGLGRVNELYKAYKEKNRKSENSDRSSTENGEALNGSDNAPGGSDRRAARAARTAKTIPSSLRNKVLKRDGHKCQAPGCGRICFLRVHHIEPEGAGGATEEQNLCTVCDRCHDSVHEERLSVEGKAPHQLIWRDERGQLL